MNDRGPGRLPARWEAVLTARRWLCSRTCEIELSRPPGFSFVAGQHIRVRIGSADRDYSLVTAPDQERLGLCVRRVPGPGVSEALSAMAPGARVSFTGPSGRFVFQPSGRPAVFVATGTGIAPFVAMARSGVRGFVLLHGVPVAEELYYAGELAGAAGAYVGCVSRKVAGEGLGRAGDQAAAGPRAAVGRGARHLYDGRVTAYLRSVLAPASYDFYLCGGTEMIRDALRIIDERFPGSLAFYESFY